MKKSASRITVYPQQEMKVYVRSQDASQTKIKQITAISNPTKNEDSLKVVRLPQTELGSDSQKTKDEKDAVRKMFSKRDSQKKSTQWKSPAGHLFLPTNKPKKKFMPVIFSVASAVIIGVVMGFSILSLFFSGHTQRSQYTIDSHLQKIHADQTPLIERSMVPLPPLRVVMLQAGIFSEKEGAQKVVDRFRSRGLVAVMSSGSPFRIYTAMASDENRAQQLARVYKKENVDVYQKDVTLESTVRLTKDQRKLERVLQNAHHLVTELSKLSSGRILQDHPARSYSELARSHRQFQQESQAVLPYLPTYAQKKMIEMKQSLTQAVSSTCVTQDRSSQVLWSKAQEGLIRYVMTYEQFIQSLHTS